MWLKCYIFPLIYVIFKCLNFGCTSVGTHCTLPNHAGINYNKKNSIKLQLLALSDSIAITITCFSDGSITATITLVAIQLNYNYMNSTHCNALQPTNTFTFINGTANMHYHSAVYMQFQIYLQLGVFSKVKISCQKHWKSLYHCRRCSDESKLDAALATRVRFPPG